MHTPHTSQACTHLMGTRAPRAHTQARNHACAHGSAHASHAGTHHVHTGTARTHKHTITRACTGVHTHHVHAHIECTHRHHAHNHLCIHTQGGRPVPLLSQSPQQERGQHWGGRDRVKAVCRGRVGGSGVRATCPASLAPPHCPAPSQGPGAGPGSACQRHTLSLYSTRHCLPLRMQNT